MTKSTRDIVIAALHEAVGVLDDPVHAPKLKAGEDIPLSSIDIDSLSTFEVVMQLEDELGLELDADEVTEQKSVAALVAFLDTRKDALEPLA